MRLFTTVLGTVAAVFLCMPAQAGVADRIVAVVNDEVITLSELNSAFEPFRKNVLATYAGADREKMLSENRLSLLNQMIDSLLIDQQSRRAGISVSDEELTSAIKDMLRRRNLSQEDLQDTLDREGTTMEAYKKGVRDQLIKIKFVQREIKSRVAVTEEEIGAYYRKHRKEYEGKEAVRIQQILLLRPKGEDAARSAKIREEAETIHRSLVNGEPFERLSARYSQGSAASGGGDIGFVERGMILHEVEEAAFRLPLNQISDVIESSVGFHIIRVVDRRGAGFKSIESVREEIREKIDQEKMSKRFDEWVDSLRAKSHIEIKP